MDGSLEDIGEREAILRIALAASSQGLSFDASDDCAVLELEGTTLLLTTDGIRSSTHLPEGASPYQIGWFSTAINLSDIAAMGGRPLGVLMALGLPRSTPQDFLEGFTEGVCACLNKHGGQYLGGDTKEASELSVTGTAVGVQEGGNLLRRSGGKPGDIVAVTGSLGRAHAGLRMIGSPDTLEDGLRLLLEVEPRVEAGLALSKTEGVHSAMDISDGLSASIWQLSEISDRGFLVDLEKVPRHDSLLSLSDEAEAEDAVLHSGGDYELLVIMDPGAFDIAARKLGAKGIPLTEIGKVTSERRNETIKAGSQIPLERRGYEHFRGKR